MKTQGNSAMPWIDAARLWAQTYRLLTTIISSVTPDLATLGLETKELFVLTAIDEHPHPAELADALCMPKPTITVYLKRLEGARLVRREIDPSDLRRHRLSVTPAGRKVMTRGLTLLSEAFGARLARLSTADQAQLAALLEKLA
jgi:DNA-binding MarR family transcriptional regulator